MTRLLAVTLMTAFALAGCSDPPPPTEAFDVRGVYLGMVYDSAAASVNHEAIPGFMDAMQMPIRVAEPALLRGLEAGDKIRFRLADAGNGYAIQTLEQLPDETVLVLAERPEPSPNGAGTPDSVRVP